MWYSEEVKSRFDINKFRRRSYLKKVSRKYVKIIRSAENNKIDENKKQHKPKLKESHSGEASLPNKNNILTGIEMRVAPAHAWQRILNAIDAFFSKPHFRFIPYIRYFISQCNMDSTFIHDIIIHLLDTLEEQLYITLYIAHQNKLRSNTNTTTTKIVPWVPPTHLRFQQHSCSQQVLDTFSRSTLYLLAKYDVTAAELEPTVRQSIGTMDTIIEELCSRSSIASGDYI